MTDASRRGSCGQLQLDLNLTGLKHAEAVVPRQFPLSFADSQSPFKGPGARRWFCRAGRAEPLDSGRLAFHWVLHRNEPSRGGREFSRVRDDTDAAAGSRQSGLSSVSQQPGMSCP